MGAYHDFLEPFADTALAVAAVVELFAQLTRLVAEPPGLGLGLLAADHGALQCGVSGLTFELLGLRSQRVELANLFVDRGDAGLEVEGAAWLLVDALGRHGLQRAGRAHAA